MSAWLGVALLVCLWPPRFLLKEVSGLSLMTEEVGTIAGLNVERHRPQQPCPSSLVPS